MTARPPPLPWTARARRLRRDQTDCEALLWSRLRNRGFVGCKFHRQFAIGRYIVDFLCREHWLIIELDGGQHALQEAADAERTRWLELQGYRVLRFWNNEVRENSEGVLQVIAATLLPSPRPSPLGEGNTGAAQSSPPGEGARESARVRGAPGKWGTGEPTR